MSCKIYVGNLAWATDENALGLHFACIGTVKEAVVMRTDGRSRGFGFVTFTTVDEAERALATMDCTQLHGRKIRVNVASQPSRPTGMNTTDHTGTGAIPPGYHYPPVGYPSNASAPYPGTPYGGYQPSPLTGPFMNTGGYCLNPSMSYSGAAPGFDTPGPSNNRQPTDNRKSGGSQSSGFYPSGAPYSYPPVGYGQQPY